MPSPVKHIKTLAATAPVTQIDEGGATGAFRQVTLRFLVMINTTAAVAYFQIFAKPSADVTLGTTVPDLSIGLPASSAMVFPVPESGIFMGGKGLTVAGTTTRLGLTAAIIDANLGYD